MFSTSSKGLFNPPAALVRQHKGLPDFVQRDSLRCFCHRAGETFDRLTKRFYAQTKCLMMHRHDETRAGRVRHRDGLFRSGMSPNPRVVSADAHDGEIVGRAIIQFSERVGHGGIATVNDASFVARDDVAVVSAMDVVLHSRAPMFWLERTH